jgi:hypothetical protein
MVCSVQTVLQACTDTKTISKWTKTRFYMTHVTYEFHRVRPKLFLTYGTFNAYRAPIFYGPNRSPPDPHHLGVPRVLLKRFMNLWYV